MRGLLMLLIVGMAFAGCAGEPEPVTEEIISFELEATATTGVIRGVVVDAAIRPLPDAQVSVQVSNGTVETTTNGEGMFGFSKIEPGTYFVKVSKKGYTPAQSSAEVTAGVDNPPAVKFILEIDLENLAYAVEYSWNGFIECSTTYLALCAVPNDGPEIVCIVSMGNVCLGNVTNDDFIHNFAIDKPPQWVQSEMVWDTTQTLSDRMWLWHSYANEDGVFQGSIKSVTGPSPLKIASNETEAGEVSLGAPNMLTIRIFSGDVEGTTPPICVLFCNGPGVAIQQEFQVFTHVFYNYVPSEEWRFSDGTGIPQP